jgi:hypothetical protein
MLRISDPAFVSRGVQAGEYGDGDRLDRAVDKVEVMVRTNPIVGWLREVAKRFGKAVASGASKVIVALGLRLDLLFEDRR